MARTLLATVTALVIACGCARKSAQETQAAPELSSHTSAPELPKQNAAVRAYIDPVTGELRDPTTEELTAEAAAQAAKKQAAAANPQAEQLQHREVVLPSGTVEITLDTSAQHPLRACIQKNGDLKMDHECEADANKDRANGIKR